MDRTVRAAVVAGLSVALTIGLLGPFLGFPTTPAVITAAALGLLAGLLLWGASRRADSFHPTDPDAHLADHRDADADDSSAPRTRDDSSAPRTRDDH